MSLSLKPNFISLMLMMIYHIGCQGQMEELDKQSSPLKQNTSFDTSFKYIHVYVALCDNTYQGIVPVPAKIGNGQDPNNNLYWGCGYGVKSFFKKSKEWELIKTMKGDSLIIERLIFKHYLKKYYLIAEAYNGKYIKQCTNDFLAACSGNTKDTLMLPNKTIGTDGNASLIAYIGHDGLMDFELPNTFENADQKQRDGIILACISKTYFAPYLETAKTYPMIWTTGLMCPEAYTLHDAISGYVLGESYTQIKHRASLAYAKYQKCSLKAAQNLLVTGWK
jgi:hypothetical protein